MQDILNIGRAMLKRAADTGIPVGPTYGPTPRAKGRPAGPPPVVPDPSGLGIRTVPHPSPVATRRTTPIRDAGEAIGRAEQVRSDTAQADWTQRTAEGALSGKGEFSTVPSDMPGRMQASRQRIAQEMAARLYPTDYASKLKAEMRGDDGRPKSEYLAPWWRRIFVSKDNPRGKLTEQARKDLEYAEKLVEWNESRRSKFFRHNLGYDILRFGPGKEIAMPGVTAPRAPTQEAYREWLNDRATAFRDFVLPEGDRNLVASNEAIRKLLARHYQYSAPAMARATSGEDYERLLREARYPDRYATTMAQDAELARLRNAAIDMIRRKYGVPLQQATALYRMLEEGGPLGIFN